MGRAQKVKSITKTSPGSEKLLASGPAYAAITDDDPNSGLWIDVVHGKLKKPSKLSKGSKPTATYIQPVNGSTNCLKRKSVSYSSFSLLPSPQSSQIDAKRSPRSSPRNSSAPISSCPVATKVRKSARVAAAKPVTQPQPAVPSSPVASKAQPRTAAASFLVSQVQFASPTPSAVSPQSQPSICSPGLRPLTSYSEAVCSSNPASSSGVTSLVLHNSPSSSDYFLAASSLVCSTPTSADHSSPPQLSPSLSVGSSVSSSSAKSTSSSSEVLPRINCRSLLSPSKRAEYDSLSSSVEFSDSTMEDADLPSPSKLNRRNGSTSILELISSTPDSNIQEGPPIKFVEGIRANTHILQIPLDKYGTLLGLVPSMAFIPEKFKNRIRDAFIWVMGEVIRSPHDISNWKKLILLPSLILTRCSKTILNKRLLDIRSNNWNVTVHDLLSHQLKKKSASDKEAVVRKYIKASRISKAMQCVLSDNSIPPDSYKAFEKLKLKHPQFNLDADLSVIQQLKSFVVPEDQRIKVSAAMIRNIIGKWKTMVRPGVDKLRNEHLKELIGHQSKQLLGREKDFAMSLAKIVQILANGLFPAEVADALRDNELIALLKLVDDVRPIGIGYTLRKLTSSVWFKDLNKFNEEHFKHFQAGLRPNGTEFIIHSINQSLELHPDYDLYTIDADNAFNRSNRILGLQQVMKYCPGLLPFMRAMYLSKSNGWYYGLEEGIQSVPSSSGYHQGDVLASWLYMMTNQPLLHKIHENIQESFPEEMDQYKQLWYVDDGNIHASRKVMEIIIQTLKKEGPNFGYFINPKKGKYLIGKCDSYEAAEEVRAKLINDFEFNNDIILNHPDNIAPNANDEAYLSIYGAKILGSFVGTPEYKRTMLQKYLTDELHVDMQKLLDHQDLQERYILFRHSFIKKPLHLFRTVSPLYTDQFIESWVNIKKIILCSIIGCDLENWSQLHDEVAQLSIEDGGLGIENHRIIRTSAYLASVIDYNKRCSKIIPENTDLTTVPENSFLGHFIVYSINYLNENETWKTVEDLLRIEGKNGSTVQNQLTKFRYKTFQNDVETDIRNESIHWYTWHKGHGGESQAGHWLNMIPKFQKFYMDPLDFRTALRHYMYFKMEKFVEGQTCICRHHPTLDPFGHHLGSGCLNGGFTTNTHNDLVRELNSILRYAGYHTKLEENGIFINTVDENFHRLSAEEQRGLRPDISVNNYSPFEAKLCLDDDENPEIF